VNDAFGHPQSVVVFGGSSEIAAAVLDRLGHRCRSLVLAGRDPSALAESSRAMRESVDRVETVVFDAATTGDVDKTVACCFEAADAEVDLVVMAVGDLGDQEADETDPGAVARRLTVNFVWPAAALTATADRLRAQGHGRLVILSSVAGYRVRRSNFVYGSGKAGLDGFAVGLGEALRGSGVTVHVVRPGFVRTKMTAGRPAAPFAVGPARVAADIVRGIERGDTVIWSPGILRWVFGVLRSLPQSAWRRLPG
jgi:decaprenylphospho-beta-D-erythro-pentofuranosid-2-ulose 2-reductase